MLGPTMRLAVGCLVFVALVPVGAVAQQAPAPAAGIGTIAGQVLDASSGDPIIEAGVEVIGTGKTARTDLDGKFTVKVPPGTYQVRFFAPLYTGARLDRIVVQPDKVTKADVTLSSGGQAGVEVVEVVADADKAAERTQLLRRQKAPVVSDNIAAETIKKSPDSDAAEVVARVPAVTVKDDKFVVVRGLGERYSSALLEGSRLPSSDPSKRVVPLDLFPADFIESISIVKTYTPDLPGDFSGGLADIRLVEFPEKLSYNLGVSTGGNTEATFQDFDTYKGGGFDYFGFDQNVRSLPSLIPDRNLGEGSAAAGAARRLRPFLQEHLGTVLDDRTAQFRNQLLHRQHVRPARATLGRELQYRVLGSSRPHRTHVPERGADHRRPTGHPPGRRFQIRRERLRDQARRPPHLRIQSRARAPHLDAKPDHPSHDRRGRDRNRHYRESWRNHPRLDVVALRPGGAGVRAVRWRAQVSVDRRRLADGILAHHPGGTGQSHYAQVRREAPTTASEPSAPSTTSPST